MDPSLGTAYGNFTVTILGQDLGVGNDVYSVSLANQPVAAILSQSSTRILVTAGRLLSTVTGPVVVTSTSFGNATLQNGFSYTQAYNITPTVGPATGGTMVNMTGLFQFVGVNYYCQFGNAGNAVVPATRLSLYSLVCVTPSVSTRGSVGVNVTWGDNVYLSAGSFYFYGTLNIFPFDLLILFANSFVYYRDDGDQH